MSTVDFSVLDLPRTEVVQDAEAYLRAAVQWHFSSATGSPYSLQRANSLGFDPLTDIKSFDDLALFPSSSTNCATGNNRPSNGSSASWTNLYRGHQPTFQMAPHVPHDGYLADFLMRSKGFIRD
jgi:hypothetical protein